MTSRPIQLDEISRAIGGSVVGSSDATVWGVSSLAEAGPTDLGYVASDRFIKAAMESQAAAFIVSREIPDLARPQILVKNPAYAFARIAEMFFVAPSQSRGISEPIARGEGVEIGDQASIWPFVTLGDRARIGARVTLYPGVFIGDDAVIGDDSVLYPNVTVREGCRIGSRVIIHSGTVIGSDGFGYVQHEGRHQKIPQLGIACLEDDVELGANVTVDRATFGQTVIKRGTKVDNLVQVAHNVTIGEHSILVAQVGIAGSTRLGHHVIVGGQAGLADHLEIGDQVMIAARSGVNRSLTGNQIVSGAPVMPHEVAMKAMAVIPRLPELRRQLRELEQRVQALEGKSTKGKVKKKK
ncbi:MAG TPA: UDP-3-O-(3-hydroxymyristoyl)glucosamine N-acyltransferase [Nitrospiraceae bacterium]|nr:UDP-3-O-(3-hydroxymyristoyl)glucosamine N-acyltransferase [Nitrospiraceae bacterium]